MKKKKIYMFFWALILIVLIYSIRFATNNFGNIGLSEIVYTLNMPMKGVDQQYYKKYFFEALIPILLCLGVFVFVLNKKWCKLKICITTLNKKREYIVFPLEHNLFLYTLICILLLFSILEKANTEFGLFDYMRGQIEDSTFIEENYVQPQTEILNFPKQKRNLIWIYMESAETTFQDISNGGMMDTNLIPEMTLIAKENISFSQTNEISGAAVAPSCGWTIAGLVAQTSGLPLKLFSYDDYNSMDKYIKFMPGAISLGEILENEGYHNVFMAGSDFDFGGRTDYFTQHGNYEIIDGKKEIKGTLPEKYLGPWGLADCKLYMDAKEELTKLATEEEPFNFAMITVDTHTGGGHVCPLCPDNYSNQYWNVWECASKQVYDFVQWIKEQDFYENTTICITGDHCSMETDFLDMDRIDNYDKFNGGTTRRVYNAIINSAIDSSKMKERKFTTLDYFPTVLASMGVEIEGNRLGLGTNLFSDEQTLSEEYGYDYIMEELGKNSNFYNNQILYSKNQGE